ncbi:dTDP-glucose 4,6-dehydratase [Nonomuraea sp. NPDC059007]|uniref:dTDP-glucose 4,6-dehydratase n=1 Tax=Nonomuraea sp. NPDC059007 TaxID=3346692 RepID=UPI0036A82A76
MKVLVTGGAGFIGSNYVRSLLGGAYVGYEDVHVTVVDKLTYAGNTANLPMDHPRLSFVKADICDAATLYDVVRGHDAVVHLAAESHVDRSLLSAGEFVISNVLGTQAVLECSLRAGVERVVHVSTDEVYGSIGEGSWTEKQRLQPNSPYAAAKAGADLLAWSYYQSHRLPVCVTRCSNNYGPHQFIEKIIPLFVTNLLDGRPVPLYGDGLHVREWLHVDDHCRGLQLVLERGRPGEIYHLGGGTELTNLDLVRQLLTLCGADWDRVQFVDDRKGHDRRYSLDGEKARHELGYEARVPFDRGLADVVDWYRDNRWWWAPLRETAEFFKYGLPRGW